MSKYNIGEYVKIKKEVIDKSYDEWKLYVKKHNDIVYIENISNGFLYFGDKFAVNENDIECKINAPNDYNNDKIKMIDYIVHQITFNLLTKTLPENDKKYYYIDSDGKVDFTSKSNRSVDYEGFLIGNCFETEKEAEENKDKILNIYKLIEEYCKE